MIECIFTLDYEIYGSGEGSLRELVYEPARELKCLFDQAGAKLVVFVEAAELEQIGAAGTDPAIHEVHHQLREFRQQGHEIGLHLHPQWYNARYRDGAWELDYAAYNLCTLPKPRIEEMINRSIAWLRSVLGDPQFTPVSFRAGNWLFQPTANVAHVLAERGIKLDSSVFKGGLQHDQRLDYRAARNNGWYWRFGSDVNTRDPRGALLEIPIYTRMVPFWRMLTAKRLALEQKARAAAQKTVSQQRTRRVNRLRDYLRFRYPLKFDFCRMTSRELTSIIEEAIQEDRAQPGPLKPLVAIGHTKDLLDFKIVASFLAFLRRKGIAVSTLEQVYSKCRP